MGVRVAAGRRGTRVAENASRERSPKRYTKGRGTRRRVAFERARTWMCERGAGRVPWRVADSTTLAATSAWGGWGRRCGRGRDASRSAWAKALASGRVPNGMETFFVFDGSGERRGRVARTEEGDVPKRTDIWRGMKRAGGGGVRASGWKARRVCERASTLPLLSCTAGAKVWRVPRRIGMMVWARSSSDGSLFDNFRFLRG